MKLNGRRDLLRRHCIVHGKIDDGILDERVVTRSAGRTPFACSNCAKNKTKCDQNSPCGRCAKRKLKCTDRPIVRQPKYIRKAHATGSVESAPKVSVQTSSDGMRVSPSSQDPTETSVQEDDCEIEVAAIQEPSLETSIPTTLASNGTLAAQNHASQYVEDQTMHSLVQQLEEVIDERAACPVLENIDVSAPDVQTSIWPCWSNVQGSTLGAGSKHTMDYAQMVILPSGAPEMLYENNHFSSLPSWLEQSTAAPAISTAHAFPSLQSNFSAPWDLDAMSIGQTECTDFSTVVATDDQRPAHSRAKEHMSASTERNLPKCDPEDSGLSWPTSAYSNMQSLKRNTQDQDISMRMDERYHPSCVSGLRPVVAPVDPNARDKLLAATQVLFLKGTQTSHGSSMPDNGSARRTLAGLDCVIGLPASLQLTQCLHTHVRCNATTVNLFAQNKLNVNGIIHADGCEDSSLLLALTSIGQGAMWLPLPSIQAIGTGLVEVCMTYVASLDPRDGALQRDPNLLHAVLVVTASAISSGDERLMERGRTVRTLYSNSFRALGVEAEQTDESDVVKSLEKVWREWICNETKRR